MTGETYTARRSAFDKTPWEWRIEDDALVSRDHKGREFRDRWADVTSIRMAYTPIQYQTWRHVAVLGFKGGAKRVISNSHFKGMGDFENRSTTYAPFARELLHRVQAKAPTATARTGSGPVLYWTTVIVIGLLLLVLAAIFLLIPAEKFGDASPSIWIRLGVVAIFLPVMLLYARRAYPRGVKLSEFPEDALPKPA